MFLNMYCLFWFISLGISYATLFYCILFIQLNLV